MTKIPFDRKDMIEAPPIETGWANPPTLEDIKRDYSEALPCHSEHVTKVNKYYKILDGTLDRKPKEGRSRVQPKLARKHAEWRCTSLSRPYVTALDMYKVSPVTHEDVEVALQNERILNKQWRVDINRVEFIDTATRSLTYTGNALVKYSWEELMGTVMEEQPVFAQTQEELTMFFQQALASGQMTEEQAHQLLQSGQPIPIGKELVEVEYPVINRPVVEIKDTRDVIIDPTCEGNTDKARFIIDTFETDLSTLKQDGRYHNLDYIVLEDDTEEPASGEEKIKEFKYNDDPRKKLKVYEYWGFWDIDGTGIVKSIVMTYVGNTMIRLEENPYPDKKLPFILVKYMLPLDLKSIYGEPDAELLEDNQKIIGGLTRGIIDTFGRSANGQQAFIKGALDPINKRLFNKGDDFEVAPTGLPIKDSYTMMTFPEIPVGAYDLIRIQQEEAESLTGIKPFSQGIAGDAYGNSVGGSKIALDATAKREASILIRLSKGLEELGRRIASMNSVWLSDEEVVRITDSEFVTVSRETLSGNFDITIAISTAEEEETKASELSFMLQTMGNSLDINLTKLLLVELAELRKFPELAERIRQYEPKPDPMAIKLQELQIQLLEHQIANEEAKTHSEYAKTEGEYVKAQENMADIDFKKARTQTEIAKARELSSRADAIDLDYVNNASGVTQAKEIEKLLANKRSN